MGLLSASKRVGLVICLTEMRLTCSEVRKPKDMLVTSVGTGCAGLAMADAASTQPSCVQCSLQQPTSSSSSAPA